MILPAESVRDNADCVPDEQGVRFENLRSKSVEDVVEGFIHRHGSSFSNGADGHQRNVLHIDYVSNSQIQGTHHAESAVISVGSFRLDDDYLSVLHSDSFLIGGIGISPAMAFSCFKVRFVSLTL